LKLFGGASALEIVEDYDRDTYRAVYTVRFAEAVYVLTAFKRNPAAGSQPTGAT
jgi:phage-related protein